MSEPVFFNAQHSPVGAFASFTLGAKGACGGFGLEIGGPANEEVFVGAENDDGSYAALPFFTEGSRGFDENEFDVESLSGLGRTPRVRAFPDGTVRREFSACVDEWTAGDLRFGLISPARSVPDPQSCAPENLRRAIVPAVLAELTLDNRAGTKARKVFFGYHGSNRTCAMRTWRHNGLVCIGQGEVAIGCLDAGVYGGCGFQPEAVLEPRSRENLGFMLGRVGLLVGEVPASELKTFRFAITFFREGNVTAGLRSRYLYRRFFRAMEEVLEYSLAEFDDSIAAARSFDEKLLPLSEERRWMLAQAVRSYYGSTQCLELEDGQPLWIVNEGEYRMMNTLDLMADQVFFELSMNPWTVRNELDFYVSRHSYRDQVFKQATREVREGGLAFTHDVGVANTFAEPGHSGYELSGLTGCFSHMSAEELVNWTLCASLYALHTQDHSWLTARRKTLEDCLESLMRRDDPDPAKRNGIISWDSVRCGGGSEITTYDSLDASLGQARGNVYLAVKAWAAYILLAKCFERLGDAALADSASRMAELVGRSVSNAAESDGRLPAILEKSVEARIIPAIEGLAFPLFLGSLPQEEAHRKLIATLERHLRIVLESGECRFEDGAWRLSSTSRNSWLSKIYLCQHVATSVFNMPDDEKADRAHKAWLTRPDNGYFAWSDQMLEGRAVGSRYYPRGVTAWLWITRSASQDSVGFGAKEDEFNV